MLNPLPLVLSVPIGGGRAETSGGTSGFGAARSAVARACMATGKSSAATGSAPVPSERHHRLHEAALDPHALETRAQDGHSRGGSRGQME